MPHAIDRRSFLKASASSAFLLGSGWLGCDVSEIGPGPLEGVYSDRFTYRHGETVRLHLALGSPAPIDIDLIRVDQTPATLAARFTVSASTIQERVDPGLRGAAFEVAAEFPASDLPVGLYEGRIDASRMMEANRVNAWNGYPSRNSVFSFVVTDAVPGSRSRILLLHDTLTPACYDGFGNVSIYPTVPGKSSVALQRPGIERSTGNPIEVLRFLQGEGHAFEYLDLVALTQAPTGFLDAYDLVVLLGSHEYQTHESMLHLSDFVAGGGNLLIGSNELGAFRARLEGDRLTTHKWYAPSRDMAVAVSEALASTDPVQAAQVRARVAGVGMSFTDSVWETEISGQTVWLAHSVSPSGTAPLPTVDHPSTNWLFDGTGVTPGQDLPGGLRHFATGNVVAFDDQGRPFVADPSATKSPDDMVIWGYAPSADARDWSQANGDSFSNWPSIAGHALASFQERSTGAQILTLPTHMTLTRNMDNPIHQQLLRNIIARLSVRA